jgi:hypothetical protein
MNVNVGKEMQKMCQDFFMDWIFQIFFNNGDSEVMNDEMGEAFITHEKCKMFIIFQEKGSFPRNRRKLKEN